MTLNTSLYTGFQRFMIEILDGFQKDMNGKFVANYYSSMGGQSSQVDHLTETEQSKYGQFIQVFCQFTKIRFAPSDCYAEILDLTRAQTNKITFTTLYLNGRLNADVVGIVLQYMPAEANTEEVLPSSYYYDSGAGYSENEVAPRREALEKAKEAWRLRVAARVDVVVQFKLGCLCQNLLANAH